MLTGLLIFLLIIVALLAIPLELEFKLEWPDDVQNEIALSWAWGLVHSRIPVKDTKKDPAAESQQTESGKSRKSRASNVLAAIRQRPFRRRLYRFASDLWRSIVKQDVRIRSRIGLGDPADTGLLWAICGPMSGMLAGNRSVSVRVEPDFANTTFEFAGSGRVRVVPLRVLGLSLGLLVSPAIWRGVATMRAA